MTTSSRIFRTSRRVRVGDCDSNGVVRIDALARYLQDIGYDDTDDIGVGDGGFWVARSISMSFPQPSLWPRRNEIIHLETYCGGAGKAFAQRRVNIATEQSATIETSTVWVSVNEEGKPVAVPQWLLDAYPDAQKVSATRILSVALRGDADAQDIPWHLRASDFDINDHANNALAFDALYEVAHTISAPTPSEIVIEYHNPIETHDMARLIYRVDQAGFDAWLVNNDHVAAVMRWTHDA